MLIDWFTTAAQEVNFVILVALLRHFLYRRVQRSIDHRRQDLADERETAQAAREAADAEAQRHREKLAELTSRSEDLMRAARAEAGERREELYAEARAEIERRREDWRRALDSERDRFAAQVATRVGNSAIRIAERVLDELAGIPVEEAMLDRFVQHLRHLDESGRARLAGVLTSGDDVVVVASFAVDENRRAALEETIRDEFGLEVSRFATDTDLIAGVRLVTGGHVVGWSVRDLLDDLAVELEPQVGAETAP